MCHSFTFIYHPKNVGSKCKIAYLTNGRCILPSVVFFFSIKEAAGPSFMKRGYVSSGNTPQKPPAKKPPNISEGQNSEQIRRTPKRLSFSKGVSTSARVCNRL